MAAAVAMTAPTMADGARENEPGDVVDGVAVSPERAGVAGGGEDGGDDEGRHDDGRRRGDECPRGAACQGMKARAWHRGP